jgi:hypothetical protein
VLEVCFPSDVTRQLERLADILKTYPCLTYLQLIVDSSARDHENEDDPPYGHMLPEELAARKAIKVLSRCGLRLAFFTLAMRYPEHDYVVSASEYHLRVHSDPALCETVSGKVLEHDMDMYGDLRICNFEELVKRKTGFEADYVRE